MDEARSAFNGSLGDFCFFPGRRRRQAWRLYLITGLSLDMQDMNRETIRIQGHKIPGIEPMVHLIGQ